MLKISCFLPISLALLLFGLPASAQRLSGRVLDAATGQPVPYASISVPGTSQGTTGNEEGEFELALKLPARLIVSELGHWADTLTLATGQKQLVVRLQPAAVQLPDVVPGAYTAELLKKAYRHLQHANRSRYGQAFYRQITRLDSEPTEVQEMVWQVKVNGVGIEATTPSQGRYAKKKAAIDFRNFSVFTKSFPITRFTADSATFTWPLSLNPTTDFTLRLAGLTKDGNRELAEIEFIHSTNPAQKKGSIWVDTDTYQIVRFRQTGSSIDASTNRRAHKIVRQVTSVELVMRPLDDGSTILQYMKADYQGIMQQPRQPDVDVKVSAFTVFYNDQATPVSGVNYQPYKPDKANDLQAIKALPYDPDFWQNNSVVKRTPLEDATIKSFEQKGAFGTLLTP